jgi:hypothetical protein
MGLKIENFTDDHQGLLYKSNRASAVWADTAYRSAANETFLTKNGFVSQIHRKKPKGRAMPNTMRWANNTKSKIRARVEHVFAEQKHRMGLFVRPSGSPERRPRSERPIWSTTSNALSSYARSPSHDQLELRKLTHSTHYPIAIGLINNCRSRTVTSKLTR